MKQTHHLSYKSDANKVVPSCSFFELYKPLRHDWFHEVSENFHEIHSCGLFYGCRLSIYPRIEVYPLCGCIGSINFCICRNIHVTLLYGVLGFTHMSYLTSKISISLFFSNTMQRMCSLSSTLSRSSEKTCLIDHFLFSARSIFLLDFQVIFLYTPFFYTIASSSVLLI
jgi:hypothetical protein